MMRLPRIRVLEGLIPSTFIRYKDLVVITIIMEGFGALLLVSAPRTIQLPQDTDILYVVAPSVVISIVTAIYFLARGIVGSIRKSQLLLGLSYIFLSLYFLWPYFYFLGNKTYISKYVCGAMMCGLIIFLALNLYVVARGLLRQNNASKVLIIVLLVGVLSISLASILSGFTLAIEIISFMFLLPIASILMYIFWIIGRQTKFLSPRISMVSWGLFAVLSILWMMINGLAGILLELVFLPVLLMLIGHIVLTLEIKINSLAEEIEMLRS